MAMESIESESDRVAIQDPASAVVLDDVTRELALDWTVQDTGLLERELGQYIRWVRTFLESGDEIQSHIENSGAIAVPIGETTTPDELFAALGEGVRFNVREYDEYWVTVHYPNPEPVVTLVPKELPGTPAMLLELCEKCGDELGVPVGGIGGMFLAWLLPGFSWAMHTDHDNLYEQIAARVQVPLITSPSSLFIWGRIHEGRREEWQVTKHLERGKLHYVRVDVPHTVINRHPTESRLHLILDVHEEAAAS